MMKTATLWITKHLSKFHSKNLTGDKYKLLKESLEVTITFMEEKPISIELPKNIECIVKSTDAVVKGQTAASSYKPATLDNGLKIMVPPSSSQVRR